MCRRKFLLFALLLFRSSVCENLQGEKDDPIEGQKIDDSVEEISSETEFSLHLTTTEPSTTPETSRKLSFPVSEEKNISRAFRPSAHLGEIKESRISTSPFNNLHHISFENGVDPASYQEHLKDFKVVFQPNEPSHTEDLQGNYHAGYLETLGSSDETKTEVAEQNGNVKFQDTLDVPRFHYGALLQQHPVQFAQPVTENSGTFDLMDHQIFQNLEKPAYEQETAAIFGKPSKFHAESHKHELGGHAGINSLASPYPAGFYGHSSRPHDPDPYNAFKKPNNAVVYVQESTFMRTRKFPYPFYQSPVGYHEIEFVNRDHPVYPVMKRVSPWKKILHLIGAFLPLGLLLATLTPSVVKIDNTTTQPSIVLSKLRVADLPVEHKQSRFYGEPSNDCEERSICELILAGGSDGSSMLQNALWNLATRTSKTVAKEMGLQEVFEAVKKKNCSNLVC